MTNDQDPLLLSKREQGFSLGPFYERVGCWPVSGFLKLCILGISQVVLKLPGL